MKALLAIAALVALTGCVSTPSQQFAETDVNACKTAEGTAFVGGLLTTLAVAGSAGAAAVVPLAITAGGMQQSQERCN